MDAAPPQRRPRLPPPDAEEEAVLEPLPPELLNGILSRLPLRDAVLTSALARAWRRRWESVPSLKFNWGKGADPGAITDVLQRYSCPVNEFRHSRVRKASFRHSKRWLRLLARKNVQSLSLDFESSPPELAHTLSRSIFSCRELTFLGLDNCNVPAMPPDFAGFPHLTTLRLSYVGFPEGARELELLIATSPLLEKLYLQLLRVAYIDDMHDPWLIQAPKLRRLVIFEFSDQGWQIGHLPPLEVARIDCESDRDFAKLMTGLAWTRDLNTGIPGNGYILEGLTRPFNNLKSLLLRTSLSLVSSVSSVFCLIRSAPKLEDLTIELNDDDSDDDEVGSNFLNAQWTDDLFSTLVCVSVMNMMCKLSEMHFAEFVLSKARRLQKFHVYLHEDCPKSNEDAVTELVKYRRASPRAKLFFERMINFWDNIACDVAV